MNNGIAQVHTVGNYSISETSVIRGIDLRRFVIQKRGAKKPYVVTMQSKRHMQCSCPAGCNQLRCKHLGFVSDMMKRAPHVFVYKNPSEDSRVPANRASGIKNKKAMLAALKAAEKLSEYEKAILRDWI